MARKLTGMRFGRLTVVQPTKERNRSSIVWECRCDCGKTAFLPTSRLIKGETKSCGCLRRDNGRDNAADLTGQRFGKLVALRPTEGRRKGAVIWECQCDCGKITFAISYNLISGGTQSCGCLRKKSKRGAAHRGS